MFGFVDKELDAFKEWLARAATAPPVVMVSSRNWLIWLVPLATKDVAFSCLTMVMMVPWL